MMESTNRKHRWWIISGAALLQLMLLAAAFSLGAYVERYGWTREGLNYAGPGQGGIGGPPARPVGQQPAGPQDRPPLLPGLNAPPQVTGRLLRISPDAMELATPKGPLSVLVDQSTAYRNADGNALAQADLHPGMILAVYGEFTPGRNLLATQVVVLPPQGNQPPEP